MKYIHLSLLVILGYSGIVAQNKNAAFHGSNNFARDTDFDAVETQTYGSGFSIYTAVWPLYEKYTGQNILTGLPHTWMENQIKNVSGYPAGGVETHKTVIEGGLGWWSDTRFGTTIPKFIMGAVVDVEVNGEVRRSYANGVGAGNGDRDNAVRNWDMPEGKYGAVQLSQNVLWPPDGLNMAQGAKGEYLGYSYRPLPITDSIGNTGNQCWTLFLNSSNFKGPVAFVLPTHWTQYTEGNSQLAGLFLDANTSAETRLVSIEQHHSSGIIRDNIYARVLPMRFPKTTPNTSEIVRDHYGYATSTSWLNSVNSWFNGGPVALTNLNAGRRLAPFSSSLRDWEFEISETKDRNITFNGRNVAQRFAARENFSNGKVAGFNWSDANFSVSNEDYFEIPEYYDLRGGKWDPVHKSFGNGFLRDADFPTLNLDLKVPYLTPMEPDCQCNSSARDVWSKASAGPFIARLGDGSRVVYYWYKFRDQPALVHSDYSDNALNKMQERVEKIHRHWKKTDNYLANPSGGSLVGLDAGLIVNPPKGMEIGYVPIVTRQEDAACETTRNISGYINGRQAYAANHINHSGILLPDSRISVVAGATISLTPGFEVYEGADFRAVASPNVCGGSSNRIGQAYTTNSDLAELDNIIQNHISVIPNPNAGEFSIQLKTPVIGDLQIFDLQGRIIETTKLVGEKERLSVNLSDKKKGLYIVKVVGAEQVYTVRVVVQ